MPALGIAEEDGQAFVDLDDSGRVLLDAVPDWRAQQIGRSMRTAFLWDGHEPRPIRFDGFLQTRAQDMNERGEVLVVASREAGLEPAWTDAFVWQDGEVRAWIPAPNGHWFWGGKLNELGHVVLTAERDAPGHFTKNVRVMLWRDGGLTELGRGVQSDFRDDADEIVALDSTTGEVALWRGTERVPLTRECDEASDFGVYGQALLGPQEGDDAIATLECGTHPRTFVWRDGEAHELPTIDGQVLHVTDRNAHGDVVGNLQESTWGSALTPRPGMWRAGELVALPLPTETEWGKLGAVNDDGLFIGAYYDEKAAYFFVGNAERAGLLELETSWRTQPHLGGINADGVIVNSISEDNDVSERTYRWRPVACGDGGARSDDEDQER